MPNLFERSRIVISQISPLRVYTASVETERRLIYVCVHMVNSEESARVRTCIHVYMVPCNTLAAKRNITAAAYVMVRASARGKCATVKTRWLRNDMRNNARARTSERACGPHKARRCHFLCLADRWKLALVVTVNYSGLHMYVSIYIS